MTKFAVVAVLFLAIGMAHAEDVNINVLPPFDSADGSGLVNSTLEERCCLDMA
ncbi:hypothetical protein V7S43_003994 [Phytophthora oleae]|uniref:RxLR effector protein n=1 Tax=Phytophthora oleae TaxID=2107226 RepID=A0ABD3FVP3_9STRA